MCGVAAQGRAFVSPDARPAFVLPAKWNTARSTGEWCGANPPRDASDSNDSPRLSARGGTCHSRPNRQRPERRECQSCAYVPGTDDPYRSEPPVPSLNASTPISLRAARVVWLTMPIKRLDLKGGPKATIVCVNHEDSSHKPSSAAGERLAIHGHTTMRRATDWHVLVGIDEPPVGGGWGATRLAADIAGPMLYLSRLWICRAIFWDDNRPGDMGETWIGGLTWHPAPRLEFGSR